MAAHFIAGFIIGSIVTFGAIFLFCAFCTPPEPPLTDADLGDQPRIPGSK